MKNTKNDALSQPQDENSITRQDMVECIKMERLHLYNRGMPCGAKMVLQRLKKCGMQKLPSVSFVSKVLRENFLTNCRTGYYREDYC